MGGSAYGIPSQRRTRETTSGPRTGPEVVSTTRSACTDGVSCQAVGVLIASTSTFIGTDLAGTAAAFAAFGMFS